MKRNQKSLQLHIYKIKILNYFRKAKPQFTTFVILKLLKYYCYFYYNYKLEGVSLGAESLSYKKVS